MGATRLSDVAAYQSPWLKPSDLQGRTVVAVIEGAVVEEVRGFDGKKEARVVVTFRDKTKRLGLNRTQATALVAIAKTDVFADWKGLAVALRPSMTRSGTATIDIGPAPTTTSLIPDDQGETPE